ncbi:MMB_0454 family protein [Mycoplasmopsis adleri]|uniref:MMB_0454 family protein n=1 Tax=Mycoplasmopsis adleri TaxID=51362 RepID=UPI0038731D98
MNLLTTTCGINETFSVTEDALLDLIHNAIADTKNIKLASEPRISFLDDHSNVSFVIDVKVKRNSSLKETIESLRTEITSQFETLLDFKPKSLRICFISYY